MFTSNKTMLQHPGKLLAEYLAKNWYTQKSFSIKVWKRVSEINELIRWKRNITVARDIILSKYLTTPPKFWISKQVDYDYEQALSTWDVIAEQNVTIEHQENHWEEKEKQEENPFLEKTLDDIIEEENRQNKYLRENIFKETPLEQEKKETIKKDKPIKKNQEKRDIKELLKEEPILQETNSLKQVFDSF